MAWPINESEDRGGATGGAVPGAVNTARILMYVHAVVGVVFTVLFVLGAGAAGQTEEGRRAAEEAADKANALDAIAGLLGILGFFVLVGFLFLAPSLKKLRPTARSLTMIFAVFLIVNGLVGLVANFTPVAAISGAAFIALDGAILFLLNKPEVAQAFAQGSSGSQGSGRLDPRGLPRL